MILFSINERVIKLLKNEFNIQIIVFNIFFNKNPFFITKWRNFLNTYKVALNGFGFSTP